MPAQPLAPAELAAVFREAGAVVARQRLELLLGHADAGAVALAGAELDAIDRHQRLLFAEAEEAAPFNHEGAHVAGSVDEQVPDLAHALVVRADEVGADQAGD